MEKLESLIKILSKKKEVLFQRVQRLYDFAKKINEAANLNNFKTAYVVLDKTLNEFDELEMRFNEASLELDKKFEPTFNTAIRDLVEYIERVAIKVFEKQPHPSQAPASASLIKPEPIKLKRLEIPKFDGTQESWIVFYELFRTLVHENSELSDLEKMQHLVSCLTGAALSICKNITPTGPNYGSTWKALINRFNDIRALGDGYLEKIFNFKPLRLETRRGLVAVLDGFCAPVAALQQLGIPDVVDFIFLNRALHVLDPVSKREFEAAFREKDIPTYQDLVTFLERHLRTLPAMERAVMERAVESVSKKTVTAPWSRSITRNFLVSADSKIDHKISSPCFCCKGQGHKLQFCPDFLKLTPWKRFGVVKSHLLCFRCFSDKHRASSCVIKENCARCQAPHNSLLHFEERPTEKGAEILPNPPTVLCTWKDPILKPKENSTVILSTIVVEVPDIKGNRHNVRFLLDSGSQANFICGKICEKLGLPVEGSDASVVGFGGAKSSVSGKTSTSIFSRFDPRVVLRFDAYVVEQISEKIPSRSVDISTLDYLKGLDLADSQFNRPGEIHGIIGAGLFPFVVNGEKIVVSPEMPAAYHTAFGCVIMGPLPTTLGNSEKCAFVATEENVEILLKRFWEIEEVPPLLEARVNKEDIECEKLFSASVRRLESGRYMVALPFRESPENLGNSFEAACKRFSNLEKQFQRSPDLKEAYHAAMRDYLDQGHISLSTDYDPSSGYFIPQHAIFKPQSSSTPLRIVFDASAKGSQGWSLNDVLFTGPKLQTNLVSLLLNFRLFPYALTADIKQMYRQILVCPEHRQYQQLVWRFQPHEPLQIGRLNCVVFGVSSSPFLALRTIRQLVEDEKSAHPIAAEYLLRDMYVDDFLTSVPSKEEAVQLYAECKTLLKRGGFELCKWATNSPTVQGQFADADVRPDRKEFENDNRCTVLGLRWNPRLDVFDFRIQPEKRPGTKRDILSTVARIFDPLGFLAPVTLYLKILIQKLWIEGAAWDQSPSANVLEKWDNFQEQFEELSAVSIPRFIGVSARSQLVLVGFADASETGYGAVVYLQVICDNAEPTVFLVCGKSKVAPTKVLSIPRLELCAALLLSKLLQGVVENFRARDLHPTTKSFTDSTVVLCWLRSSPTRWTTFVANRVAKIQSLMEVTTWAHVEGRENPADCVSRGVTPKELGNHELWWHGPKWLLEEEAHWPQSCISVDFQHPPEERSPSCCVAVAMENPNIFIDFIARFSSFSKLRRSMVVVLRFVGILPRQKLISADEVDQAENVLCRIVQAEFFNSEKRALEKGQPCSNRLQRLAPFLDNGLIRVGGRLRQAGVEFNYAHPIVLPKDGHFVRLLVRFYHLQHLHTGPHLLLSILRHKFWILSARPLVRKIIRECNVCFRVKPRATLPLMGDLASCRVTGAKAFWKTGVDYAGPWSISLGRRRKPIIQKAYICLFVCLATKALHLELVSDLSTPAFLAAFKRFLSRRGACSEMYSDCGTNFVGSHRELEALSRLHASSEFQSALVDGLDEYKIRWNFIPPRAPHFGGIWESNIKSVKSHLFRVVGDQLLTYEELNTCLVQIEALLNSRPLCPLSEDPAEILALTPAHFLTLTPLKSLPAADVAHLAGSRLSRYQLLDKMVQSFWARWTQEYLHELQVRAKWVKPTVSLQVGTLVVVNQSPMPPLQWALGRIEEVFPGPDGVVRVALVRTQKGLFKRPVVKLCPLPSQ